MTNDDELMSLSDKELIASAMLCQAFKGTPMYALLDTLMESLEGEALDALCAARTNNKEELYGLTLRWQERKLMRQSIFDQIDTIISDGRELMATNNIDPDEFAIRSIHGG